ncbi:MAG TPA: DUF302 domain-containing protein [Pyrinomonadaceae bacterium]|nr:DUF302 domain-containing protein [Pyrinomonadaceae bacterium]
MNETLLAPQETATEGLITLKSDFDPKATMDRLEDEVRAQKMQIFARIDHSAGAAEAGLKLRPTELLIFGGALGGTPLMQSGQTVGIDLPLKVLVWQDSAGKTWLSYNEPDWIAQRHGVMNAQAAVNKMISLLRQLSTRATTLGK